MNVDIPPPERRVKYQSILTVAVLPSIIAMPLLGGLVRTVTGSYAPVALLAAVSVFFAFVLLLKIKEPRFG